MDISPPIDAIYAAIEIAMAGPCSKSRRVVIFARTSPLVLVSRGHNAPPGRFRCDGTAECKAACRDICVHAEAAALLDMKLVYGRGLELVHVKVSDGELQVSGPPSCARCSALILKQKAITLVWLFHDTGWQPYEPAEFHRLSLEANGLPTAVSVDGD